MDDLHWTIAFGGRDDGNDVLWMRWKKMRMIDADAIFNNELLLVSDKAYDAVHAVIERINNAPTVDAVEVVRCKDCVGCDRDDGSPWCGLVGLHVDDDHYCAWGERRED